MSLPVLRALKAGARHHRQARTTCGGGPSFSRTGGAAWVTRAYAVKSGGGAAKGGAKSAEAAPEKEGEASVLVGDGEPGA